MANKCSKWISSKFPGVRFRCHETRKHGVKFDRYFAIRYQLAGKRKEEGLGWASDGWTEQKAALELSKLKEAAATGEGPVRLAEKREIAEKKRVAAEELRQQQARDNISFDVLFAEHYLKWAEMHKKHWGNDEYRYRCHLKSIVGDIAIKDISPFTIEKIKADLKKKGLAPATIRHCFAIVRQVFNKAIQWGLFNGQSPIRKGVKAPHVDNQKVRILTIVDERLLLSVLLAKSQNVHDMTIMALYAGLRFSEIASLSWQSVDFEHGLLSIRGKGDKSRVIPLCERVKKLLQERKGESADLIFPNRKGDVAGKISAVFPRTVNDLGLNEGLDKRHRLDFHAMRHTFASRLAMNGTPLPVLRDLLGHSDLQMVSRYSHLTPSAAAKAVSFLDDYGDAENKVLPMVKTGS